MKKILAIILAVLMCISSVAMIASCSNKGDTSTENTTPTQTEAPTEVPTEVPTQGEEVTTEEPLPEETILDKALAYVHQLYKDIKYETAANYDLLKSVNIDNVVYNVSWTVEGTDKVSVVEKDERYVTVVVPDLGDSAIEYTLKASITIDGETGTKEYKHAVPKFKVNTFAEYAEAEDEALVIIEGIVTGIVSKATGSSANGLYLQDLNNEGGYYVYGLADDPSGVVEVGMKLQVSGAKDNYNGTYEIVNASYKILDDGAKTPVAPVDYTAVLSGAAQLNDAALVSKQGMLVTVKGVTVGEPGDNGYYYFMLGEHKTYLRISSSNNPTTKEALETIKTNFAANFGNKADVTGIISIYSGNFYLSPVSADAFANFVMPERTDAEKVDFELSALKVDSQINADKTVTLAATGVVYSDVVITWTSNSEFAVVDGANVTFKIPDDATDVVLTATATINGVTATKTFTVKLSKTLTSVKDAIDLGASKEHNVYTEGKYLVGGIITEIYNEQYGNLKIKDAAGNILTVYGTYSADGSVRFDKLENKPQVGDYIIVLGIIGQYNGTPQLKNGWIQSFTTTTSVKDAIDLGASKEHNVYTDDKYLVVGEITEIYNEQYGNLKIKDAEGNILTVYGTYNEDGKVRFDKLDKKPVVGDTIAVYGILGQYNGTPQLKNGWIMSIEAGSGDAPGTDDPVTPPVVDYVTDKDALDALYALESGASATGNYKITGTITALDSYGNPTIVVTGYDNKPVYCYRLTDTRFVVGATVTVTAKQIKNFNGTYEFMDCAVVSVGGSTEPDDPVTPPTPPVTGGAEVKKPVAGTAYKLVMNQVKAGKVVYLDGGVSGYYLSTTEDFASALDFYIEETTGGFYVYTMISGAKKYLNMVVSGTHVNAVYGDTASTVYTYNETIKTMVGVVDGADYVFGTRNDNTYTTVGANALSYNPFMVQFVTEAGTPGEGGGSTDPDEPVTPPAPPATQGGTVNVTLADKGWVNESQHNTLEMDSNITVKAQGTAVGDYGLNTGKYYTSDSTWRIYQSESATLTIVAAEGYVIKSVKITYSSKNGGTLTFNGANVATGTAVTANASSVVLGTASTSGSTKGQVKITAIEVVYEVGGSQGGNNPGGDDGEEETTTEEVTYYVAEKPVEGTKYNMAMYQGKAKKLVYVNGAMNGYYMNTVTSIGSGVNFYVEETDGGYYLYVMYKGYKFYVNMVVSGTHVNGNYQPTPKTVYTYDEALKTLVATVNGKTYAFGTRSDKTYTTIGPVDVSYNNPFLAQFVLSTNDDVVANEPAGGVIITIEDANTVLNAFPSYGATSYNQFGIKGVVTKVTATSITIKNSNNKTITIKNVYNATGEVALADMEVKPGVGDTIVVMGALTNIGGKAMANGWIMQHTVHTCDMAPATCDEPSTCTICGKTEGEATEDHTWADATCKAPKTCTVCGATEGEKLADCQGWVDATCSEYGYCTVCGKRGTEYDADAHTSIKPATCIAAAYCEDCDTTIGEKDPTAHGEKTVANCVNPSACKLCGETFGEVSGEHGEIVDCECTVCGATIHTGELSVATCMVPATCGDCGEVAGEKDADNHVGFAPATCIAPATCECGATQGAKDPTAHGELGAQCVCPLCKKAVHPAFDEECGCVDCGVVVHVFDKLYPTCTNGCGTDNDHFLTVPEANDLGATKGNNAYTSDKYSVKGVITKIENTSFGNLYIKDESGREFYVYGVYSANGSTKFGSMSVQPKVGDTVILYGIIGKYSNNPQMKNGWMIAHEIHTVCEFTEATCQEPATCTICGKTQGTTVAHNYVDKFCTVCGTREGAVTVTGKYTGSTTGNMTLNTNNAAKIGLDANVFNVVPANGSSSSTVGLNKAGNFRLYGNANKNGNTLTFTVAENTVIQSITITFANTTNNANCQVSVGGTAVATSTSADKVFTVAINASEFVLKNVNASTTQVHITSIEITYYVVETEGGDVENPDVPEEETTTEAPTTEEVTTEEETTVGGGEAVENSATFNFANSTASTSTSAMNQTSLKTFLTNVYSGDVAFTVGSTVANVYPGNGSGGPISSSKLLKMGKSSGAGDFTIDFGTAKVTKVVVNCQKWSASEGGLSINGTSKTPSDATAQDLTFEFANGVSSLQFKSTKRIVVYSITVYFA